MFKWKKGMRVARLLLGPGLARSAIIGTVEKVNPKRGTVTLQGDSIVFDLEGNEASPMVPGMRTQITPLEE